MYSDPNTLVQGDSLAVSISEFVQISEINALFNDNNRNQTTNNLSMKFIARWKKKRSNAKRLSDQLR